MPVLPGCPLLRGGTLDRRLPENVIRVLVTWYGSTRPVPVYLNGAEVLRPDLHNDDNNVTGNGSNRDHD